MTQPTAALDIKELFSRPGDPTYPFFDDQQQLCWIEAITEQAGRLALKQITPIEQRIVTPRDFQIRSRVHEYGGHCFCVIKDEIFFNNYGDGLIYRQSMHNEQPPMPISRKASRPSSYADLHYSKALNALLAVQEIEGGDEVQNESRIVMFELSEAKPTNGNVLQCGADFYAAPCVSPLGDQIAWLQWSQPHMPWDETVLNRASILKTDNHLSLVAPEIVAGGTRQSVCQPGFLRNGELVFAMDCESFDDSAQNYWNLYCTQNGDIITLTQGKAEFGEAHWVFGQCRWRQIDDSSLLAISTQDESDSLVAIDLHTGVVRKFEAKFARLFQLSTAALCIAHYVDKPAEIMQISHHSFVPLKTAKAWIDSEQVSQVEIMPFPTRDQSAAYANYYPATGKVLEQKGALLVLVHGGPTSRADTALSPLVQYFCQNGFAVLDVNHRGSTGHGRAYRQQLLGQWGELDTLDIADAIAYVIERKQLNAKLVFIRGGSAGGYAVLRALTKFPDLFCGGACYYGIGNLITLAQITHKFEGHYTDQLIGEPYDPDKATLATSKFKTRSPIFNIDQIKSPLILFQGLQDKIVPPEVSREMIDTLKQNHVKHDYIEYPDEGHGFRQAATKIDALQREIGFYQAILATL